MQRKKKSRNEDYGMSYYPGRNDNEEVRNHEATGRYRAMKRTFFLSYSNSWLLTPGFSPDVSVCSSGTIRAQFTFAWVGG
jgi:hypothetical protein